MVRWAVARGIARLPKEHVMIRHLVAAGVLLAALGMTIPVVYAASEPRCNHQQITNL